MREEDKDREFCYFIGVDVSKENLQVHCLGEEVSDDVFSNDNNFDVNQPDDDEVIFGRDKVFHIGDGQMSGSSCRFEITMHGLKGTKYYFEFEVLQENTTVDLNIGKVCGVDYGDTNFISLQQNGQSIDQKPLPIGASSAAFTSKVLGPGKYMLVVESKTGSQQAGANSNDFDDYIVGNIRVKGDKPIKPGRVGAN